MLYLLECCIVECQTSKVSVMVLTMFLRIYCKTSKDITGENCSTGGIVVLQIEDKMVRRQCNWWGHRDNIILILSLSLYLSFYWVEWFFLLFSSLVFLFLVPHRLYRENSIIVSIFKDVLNKKDTRIWKKNYFGSFPLRGVLPMTGCETLAVKPGVRREAG